MKTARWLRPALLSLALSLCAAAPAAAQVRYNSPLGLNNPSGSYGPYLARPTYVTPYAYGSVYRPAAGVYNSGLYGSRYAGAYPYGVYVPSYAGANYRFPSELYWPGIRGTVIPGAGLYAFPPLEVDRSFYYSPNPGNATPQAQTTQPADTRARLAVHIPAPNAEVWFNGYKTKQTGANRRFVTPPLVPGQLYQYQVRVVWRENGVRREANRTVQLRAGQQLPVDFGR